jgi:carboxyl-terminal processing protease
LEYFIMTKKRNKKKMIFWILGGLLALIVIAALIAGQWLTTSGYDYADLTWTEAFDQLHAQISQKYPFTEWKGIDWDTLYAQTAPRIAQAEAENDPAAYYLALRAYVYAIPDAHMQLGGPDLGLRKQAIGGGYGLGLIGLDDGRVIAHILLEDGPAAQAGMLWGAEILMWNGQPIQDALAQTSTIWASNPQATAEGRRLEQLHYLTRAPIGTEITLTFQNPGANESQTVTLTAEDDQLETLQRDIPPERDLQAVFRAPVQYEILPDGYGYIRITGFMPTLGGLQPAKIVDQAIETFNEAGVTGLIIDVRNNGGGLDTLVPQMVGHFYREPGFYEYVSFFNPESGQFEIDPAQTLPIEPRTPYFDGPVIALVDKYTISTAEGIPLTIQRLPQGYVAGIYGTNGSFAMGTPGNNLYRLPEGLGVNFLEGRALDKTQVIQVDANADGIGGVGPDLRVPLTEESVYAMYVEGADIVLAYAIAALDGLE